MKLSTGAILSLIGSVFAVISLFIPAVYGFVSGGIDSNGHITMMEIDGGVLFLLAAVVAFVFSLVEKLNKWSWIVGVAIVLYALVKLSQISSAIDSVCAQTPFFKEFIHFGSGIFVLLVGGILIASSFFFAKKDTQPE